MGTKVLFNVLAKDLENAKALSHFDADRVLVGVMVKNFATDQEAVQRVKEYTAHGILSSVGLGAGDPAMWKRVADVSCLALPYHINQVFPAAGYTLGRLEDKGDKFIINALIEPAGEPGKVYISTGEVSQSNKEPVSCELAAKLLRDIGLNSVKFYPIEGVKKLEHVRAMARAAVKEGVQIFEPTGGIDMTNVYEIVKVCVEEGVEIVIPHLYTSLVDKISGETKPEYLDTLLNMSW